MGKAEPFEWLSDQQLSQLPFADDVDRFLLWVAANMGEGDELTADMMWLLYQEYCQLERRRPIYRNQLFTALATAGVRKVRPPSWNSIRRIASSDNRAAGRPGLRYDVKRWIERHNTKQGELFRQASAA